MGRQRHVRGVRDQYAFIKERRNQFDTAMMCHVLGVSRSGLYEWLRQPLSDRAREDPRLLRLIRASHAASDGVYGAPRIFLDLREVGETCSKHRVARIMRGALYMTTLVATRHNPVIRAFYQHLLAQHKPKKFALVACVRKLLVILNTMAKTKEPWRTTGAIQVAR